MSGATSSLLAANYRQNMGAARFDSFEQEFIMPPDIASIDSDISKRFLYLLPKLVVLFKDKISALTPFSDQFMPNIPGHS